MPVSLSFRLDTGSDVTTIPIALARRMGIPFETAIQATPMTASGTARQPSFFSRVSFSLPALPQWRFDGDCLFSPYPLKYCLLSLRDLVAHFTFRSVRPNTTWPNGALILRLRPDHGGRAVP